MADSTAAAEATAADTTSTHQQSESETQAPSTTFPNANLLPSSTLVPPPPLIQPSFRPVVSPLHAPQFSALPTYQNPGIPPPGVGVVAVSSVPPAQVPGASLQQVVASPYSVAAQPLRYPLPVSNSYPPMPHHLLQGSIPPPGVIQYPSPYAPLMRPAFPPRPLVNMMPPLARSPVIGIRGPMIPPFVRPPIIPIAGVLEKPQTTVYVGKISPTVDNDFMLSLLQLCGPVKSWKRVQDPTNGTLKGFGFCEFEFAEGVLRALRLLNKLNVDGQELMLNVKQATREYLERYVEKKIESAKNSQETESECAEKGESTDLASQKDETVKSTEESLKCSDEEKKDDGEKLNKENPDAMNFGIVTEADREADCEALEKLNGMIEERLKNNPLPPPPPQTAVDDPGNSISQHPSGSKDREYDTDVAKNNSEDKNDDEKTAESKLSNENDKTETGSPDRSRRHDKSKDRDRREKERELERYEREREQERAKREKDREYRSREEERRYKLREKDWETREREREHWRKREREKEKEKYQERRWEILDQERDSDDGYGKKRRYKTSDEERKKRLREREDDLADRIREEEEIAKAKLRAAEEELLKKEDALVNVTGQPTKGQERSHLPDETYFDEHGKAVDQIFVEFPNQGVYEGEGILQNGFNDGPVNAATDERMNSNAPTRKLGFGLSGSGKRASVPSVFNQDEDEDAHKEKKMRPLVPIDYSTEEQQAGQLSVSEVPSNNLVSAADHVKRNASGNPKEERNSSEKEKSRRHHEKSGQRDRGRHDEETNARDEGRKDILDREKANKLRTQESQKLFDAKQLIDMIPKTKAELFSYEINWVIYEQNQLHERMRPWISKKITDFLGEEEVTLVDYIVSSTQEHVGADEMLERLQAILDDEAEMFVLKMWRMLIFEIKKVETGLSLRSKP